MKLYWWKETTKIAVPGIGLEKIFVHISIFAWEQEFRDLWGCLKPLGLSSLYKSFRQWLHARFPSRMNEKLSSATKQYGVASVIRFCCDISIDLHAMKMVILEIYGAISFAQKAPIVFTGTTKFDTSGYSIASQLCGALRVSGYRVLGCRNLLCGFGKTWTVFTSSDAAQASNGPIFTETPWAEVNTSQSVRLLWLRHSDWWKYVWIMFEKVSLDAQYTFACKMDVD